MRRSTVAWMLACAALAGCAETGHREKATAPWKKLAKDVEQSVANSERKEGEEEQDRTPEKDGNVFRQQGTQVR